MDVSILLDRYPWAAIHEQAIRTTAVFLGLELEKVFMAYDEKILVTFARDQFVLPRAA
ncbi:MAG: hypothetical protein PVG89_01730 [Gammaproteobacteria bacterium]|jgi:hypothetical protein